MTDYKFNKWDNTLNYSIYDNLVLSKIPKSNTNYDITNLTEFHNIDIIINLSTTSDSYIVPENSKYYNFCMEKKKLPSENDIFFILNIINSYTGNNKILIHCHYGFNRTGFIFINYLCKYKKLKLEEAKNIFLDIRGKGVKYEELNNYLVKNYD